MLCTNYYIQFPSTKASAKEIKRRKKLINPSKAQKTKFLNLKLVHNKEKKMHSSVITRYFENL